MPGPGPVVAPAQNSGTGRGSAEKTETDPTKKYVKQLQKAMILSTSFVVSEMQNAIKLEKDRLTQLRENLEREKERPDTPGTRINRNVDALEVCTPHIISQNKITTSK